MLIFLVLVQKISKKENEQLNEKINNLNNQIESLNLDKSNLEVTLSQKISENKNLTKALKEKRRKNNIIRK